MKIKITILFLVLVVLASACSTSPQQPLPTPTQPVAEPNAVSAMRLILSQRLGILLDDIQLVSFEAVDWSNSCLGLPAVDEMCAEVVTPGYKITLEAGGDLFTFHTNQRGDQFRLASAPTAGEDLPLIVWQSEVCDVISLSESGTAIGSCGGELLFVPWTNGEQPARLKELEMTFAPFEAQTPGGKVSFKGLGDTIATPADQRAIAEFGKLMFMIAQSGRAGAAWQLAFTWHREGGIAGFCDDIYVYLTGQVIVSSCKGNSPVDLGQYYLDSDQLTQLYHWVDSLTSFEVEYADPATADMMRTNMTFTGLGEISPANTDIQAINEFASSLAVQPRPTQVPDNGGGFPQAAKVARELLAQRLGVPVNEIRIVSADAMEWSDSCLGINKANEMCLMVITPGYRVILEAKGVSYVFHTDLDGRNIRQSQ